MNSIFDVFFVDFPSTTAQQKGLRVTKNGVRFYTRHEIIVFKKAMSRMVSEHMRKEKIDMIPKGIPVEVAIVFFYRNDGTHSQFEMKITKPDIDNLSKALIDSLSGIAYQDDCQVARITMSKMYGDKDQEPAIALTIIQMNTEVKS